MKKSIKSKTISDSSLLKKVINLAGKKLVSLPEYLDETTYQGHYAIGTVDYAKSHGPYLTTNQGEKYHDLTAHWNTNLIDTGKHKEMIDKRLLYHLGSLSIEAPTASEMVTAEQAAFTSMMQSFWPQAIRVFTHSSGALAVNDACWTAATIVAEKVKLEPREMKGIVFEGAFHGRHDRSADATASSHKVAFRQDPDRFIRCKSPTAVYSDSGELLKKETQKSVEESLKEVEKACKDKKSAYIIIEYPFQAEGGAKIISHDVLRKLSDLCKKYSKVLIVDCVQMGGRVWAKNKKGVMTPFPPEALEYADIITFGKVFRVSGFMAKNPRLGSRKFPVDPMQKYPERFGSTWVGGLVQMLSGVMIMQIISEDKLWKNALKQTTNAYNGLLKISKKYPGIILQPRGRLKDTTYLGWDFIDKDTRITFTSILREKYHLLVLPAGERSIRWAPFLDTTDKEMKEILGNGKWIENDGAKQT